VPEAGQSEQTQRAEVGGMWDTQSLWIMSTRVGDKDCPNQGSHGLRLPKRKKVAKGDDKRLCKTLETKA
jgi:hypothetical protein